MSDTQTEEKNQDGELMEKFPPEMSYQNVLNRRKKLEDDQRNKLKSRLRELIAKAINSDDNPIIISSPSNMNQEDKKEIIRELFALDYPKITVFNDGFVKEHVVLSDLKGVPPFQYIKIYLN